MTQLALRSFLNNLSSSNYVPTEFYQWTVGFDRLFDELQHAGAYVEQTNYPPHNVRQVDEHRYAIEVAVAGFEPSDLEVSFEKKVLTIKGTKPEASEDTKYIHRGLAMRSFEKQFRLADTVEVGEASLEHGVLTVHLENVIPERERKRLIAINRPLLGETTK